MKRIKEVDMYIRGFPKDIQSILKKIREIIEKEAPDAEEVISYKMPAYKYYGMLVYLGGHTKHIGLYPMAKAIIKFKKELKPYKTAPGSIQFPIDKPLPVTLIKQIIKFRVKENKSKNETN